MAGSSETGYASSLKGRITMMFVVLAVLMEGLFLFYWMRILEPRLEAGIESNIRSLAQSQTLALAPQLSGTDIDKNHIVQFMDNMLLLKDPSTQTPLMLALELEMDYDAVDAAPGSLDIVRRSSADADYRIRGYAVEVPIFSSETRELLGIATFYGSKAFFQRVKRDVSVGFFLGVVCILLLLFLTWWIVIVLLRPLNILAHTLRRRGGDVTNSLPRLQGVVSDEIRLVKTALDDLFSRISAYTSDLKRMQKGLEMFRFTLDYAPDAVFWMDREGQFTYVNEQACHSLGYTREELENLSLWDVDPVFPQESHVEIWDKFRSGRPTQTQQIETLHKRKDGSVFPIDVMSRQMWFDDTPLHVAFVRDITERKAMEQRLRESEERYRTLHDASFGGVFIHEKGIVLDCNLGLSKITGYSVDELLGMDAINTLIAPDWRETVVRNIESSFAQPYEIEGVRKDGSTYPLYVQGKDIPYKGRTVRAVEYRDITKLKQTEEELRRLRNYLSNIINSMPSVLVGVDAQGRITQWNRQAEQVTGLDSDHVLTKPLDSVFARLADQMATIKTAIRERRVINTPKVSRKEAQETRFEDITIFPLVANGVEGAVIRVDDVTEQVRMEEMVIQSEKMLTVGGLAAGMAHEINNPLAGMLQTAGVMENRLTTGFQIPANQKAAEAAGTTLEAIEQFMQARGIPRMINTIVSSGKRVADVVDNMLSFARKSDETTSSYDLNELLDRTLELASTDYDLKKQYDFRRIRIVKAYADDLPPVPCVSTKLQQVLLNIFGNGAQAMQSAGNANPQFIVRTYEDPGRSRVCIEIEDNGPGMDEATRKKVFNPFFTTKPTGLGTGLGLSVSYFIVTENHGGEMDVESQPGAGAKFIIRLPVPRAERA